MATYSLFISVSDIKALGYLDGNVDDSAIQKCMYTAQDMHIHPILGTALYDKLNTGIQAGSVTGIYATILTKLKPALVWATMYEGVYPFAIKIRNKGILQQNGDNTQTLQFTELNSLMDHFRSRRDEYSQRLTNYLIENESSITEYLLPGTGVDDIQPDKDNYTVSWFLGGGSKCEGPGHNSIDL